MNLDCKIRTAEVKPATLTDAGGRAKQTTHYHSLSDIVHLMFIDNCPGNSK